MSTNKVRSYTGPVPSGDRIIVRAGGREWILVHPPQTKGQNISGSQTSPPTTGVTMDKDGLINGRFHRVKDFLIWGCIFSVLLGCLSTLGLHTAIQHDRMTNVNRVARSVAVPAKHPNEPADRVKPNIPGTPIMVPAVRLYGLYVAPASRANSFHLFRVAAYSSDLLQYKSQWSGVHPVWSIRKLAWNVRQVQTAATASPNASNRVSVWLSGEVSAVSALAAFIADGEPAKDAWTAYKTAQTIRPQQKYIQSTGLSDDLNRVAQAVQGAFVAAAHGATASAQTEIANVYVDLSSIRK